MASLRFSHPNQSVFLRCFKTLTRRSWHPSEWPIFDTKTFVSNFAASTVITNSLQDLKERQQKLLFCAKLFASSKVSFHKTDRVQNKKKSVINQGLGVTFFTIYELIWIRPGHEQLVLALQRRRDKRPRNNRHQQKNDTLLLKQ